MQKDILKNQLKELDKLAWYLDSSIRIPGTKWTIGLDGIIGLIPGIGDLTAGAISSYIILQAIKRGVSFVVIARMLMNIGLETIVGVIPIVGDIFDFVFKANLRNVKLIHSYEKNPIKAKKRSGLSVALVIITVIVVLIFFVWLAIKLVSGLMQLMT